ncbi:unnamed protein product [Phytophthora lilii]|uniref:Unnamed protein product n=1 Tax=Phytophthora lilii TaxID=2077276 RepID=A0A9W6THF8_9STRA|nr:unnamed protein product [Phytophthora lilii]
MKNPAWDAGVQQLCQQIFPQLGFQDATLQPVLSKLMVIEAGGWIDKRRDPEPQYAVYSAGANWAMTEVTQGYCLVVVYSLFLPPKQPFRGPPRGRTLLRMQLAEAVKLLANDSETDEQVCDEGDAEKDIILALPLSKEYKQRDIEFAGENALSGTDRDRLQFLRSANELLPKEKKLIFFLALIRYSIPIRNLSEQPEATQRASWYTISGTRNNNGVPISLEWTERFYFLNPEREAVPDMGRRR